MTAKTGKSAALLRSKQNGLPSGMALQETPPKLADQNAGDIGTNPARNSQTAPVSVIVS